jgi:hypothetical protein
MSSRLSGLGKRIGTLKNVTSWDKMAWIKTGIVIGATSGSVVAAYLVLKRKGKGRF